MNFPGLKSFWKQNTTTKIYIGSSRIIGIFFLFSLFSKLLSLSVWLDFNYTLLDNNLGYVNGIIILAIELFYGLSFLLLYISHKTTLSCFLFILILTGVVLLNRNLFQSCMCFGNLISMKPDLSFVLKNFILLLIISTIHFLHNKSVRLH